MEDKLRLRLWRELTLRYPDTDFTFSEQPLGGVIVTCTRDFTSMKFMISAKGLTGPFGVLIDAIRQAMNEAGAWYVNPSYDPAEPREVTGRA